MKKISAFVSNDGTIFINKLDCKNHDRLKEIETWYSANKLMCESYSSIPFVEFEELLGYLKDYPETMQELLTLIQQTQQIQQIQQTQQN